MLIYFIAEYFFYLFIKIYRVFSFHIIVFHSPSLFQIFITYRVDLYKERKYSNKYRYMRVKSNVYSVVYIVVIFLLILYIYIYMDMPTKLL